MKPEFFPYFWIIYVNYVLYKRYKENKHLKKYEIILAIVSLIIISGGHFFMIYLDLSVNVNIRMYNFDDVQCTVIPSVAYGFVTGMNLQLC